MKTQEGILCNNCRVLIKTTGRMSNEDWIKLEDSDFHMCLLCEEKIGNSVRLDELERSRQHLNSDYYWKRVKELARLSDEQIDIMKFNSNQTT